MGSCWPGRKGHWRWDLTTGGTGQVTVGSLWRNIYFQAPSQSWQDSVPCGFVTVVFLVSAGNHSHSSYPSFIVSMLYTPVRFLLSLLPLFHDARNTSTVHQKQNTLHPQPCLWKIPHPFGWLLTKDINTSTSSEGSFFLPPPTASRPMWLKTAGVLFVHQCTFRKNVPPP